MSESDNTFRTTKRSFKIMENLLDSSRANLNALLGEADEMLVSTNEGELRGFLKRLKAANESFRESSLALSSWYRQNASHSSFTETNEERRHLYDEYRLSYKTLNERIVNLGFVPGSSLGDVCEHRNTAFPKVEWLAKTDLSFENPQEPLVPSGAQIGSLERSASTSVLSKCKV